MKKTITKNERLQLIGLMYLARESVKDMNRYDEAMKKIIGAGKSEYPVISEAYFDEEPDVDDCLKHMKIKVK